MKDKKYSFLLPIGIIMLLPAFFALIRNRNLMDKVFFFVALAGYVLIIIATVLGYRKITKH